MTQTLGERWYQQFLAGKSVYEIAETEQRYNGADVRCIIRALLESRGEEVPPKLRRYWEPGSETPGPGGQKR